MKDIKEKLQVAEETLKDLENKRKKIDEKILSEKKKIEEYKNAIQCQQYAEIDSQLDSLGITKEDLLIALRKDSVQELLQDKEKGQDK